MKQILLFPFLISLNALHTFISSAMCTNEKQTWNQEVRK